MGIIVDLTVNEAERQIKENLEQLGKWIFDKKIFDNKEGFEKLKDITISFYTLDGFGEKYVYRKS